MMFIPMEGEIVGGIKIKDGLFIGDEFAAQVFIYIYIYIYIHIYIYI